MADIPEDQDAKRAPGSNAERGADRHPERDADQDLTTSGNQDGVPPLDSDPNHYADFLRAFIDSNMPQQLRRFVGASDVLQDVLFAASNHTEAFHGKTSAEYHAWLRRIARNKILDHVRHYLKPKSTGGEEASHSLFGLGFGGTMDTPSRNMMAEEVASRMLRGIENLPKLHREIVQRRYLDGWTFEQIATAANISITSCRRYWLEAIEILRREVGPALHGRQ
jgi:RNA polymerase sigma-70 factor (ECF subfamily)